MAHVQTNAIYQQIFRTYIAQMISLDWIYWHFHVFIGCCFAMYYSQIVFIFVKSNPFMTFRRLDRTIFKKFLLPLHHEIKNYIQRYQSCQIQQILPERRGLLRISGLHEVERRLLRMQAMWQYTLLQRTAAFRKTMHQMQA